MFEVDVSSGAFDAFSSEGILGGQPVEVIVDTGVDVIDENSGEMRHYSYLISMYKSDAVFLKFDILTFNSKSYQLQDIISDDGIIVSISAL